MFALNFVIGLIWKWNENLFSVFLIWASSSSRKYKILSYVYWSLRFAENCLSVHIFPNTVLSIVTVACVRQPFASIEWFNWLRISTPFIWCYFHYQQPTLSQVTISIQFIEKRKFTYKRKINADCICKRGKWIIDDKYLVSLWIKLAEKKKNCVFFPWKGMENCVIYVYLLIIEEVKSSQFFFLKGGKTLFFCRSKLLFYWLFV